MKKMNIIRNYLDQFWGEFIHGGHLLSLGATCIVLSFTIVFNVKVNLLSLLIPYLISQIVYSFNHYYEYQFDITSNPERSKYIGKHSFLLPLLLTIYALVLIVSSLSINYFTFLYSILIVIGGILYTIFFKSINIFEIVGLKNFYTSFFWALLIFFIPIIYNLRFEISFFIAFIFILLRWFVNTAFFDLKDIESDKLLKIRTIPVILGKDKALLILHLVNICSLLVLILGNIFELLPFKSIYLSILTLYSTFYLVYAKKTDDLKLIRTISYVLVDGEYLLWPLIIFIFSLFKSL